MSDSDTYKKDKNMMTFLWNYFKQNYVFLNILYQESETEYEKHLAKSQVLSPGSRLLQLNLMQNYFMDAGKKNLSTC